MNKFLSVILPLFLIVPALTACTANNPPSSADQQKFEQDIRSFASAVEQKDFKSAEQYCTDDFKAYIEKLTNGKGVVSDGFSDAVVHGYALTLVDVKGFYDPGTGQPDFNLSQSKPTVDFQVTFQYTNAAGKAESAGGYVKGVKGSDGVYRIGGFASGL